MTDLSLCLACASSPSSSSSSSKPFITDCCGRPICDRCLAANTRLSSYNPCLSCLGGVGVISTARENNRKALKVGNVDADEVFVVGDSDDEDELSGRADGPPSYAAATGDPPRPADSLARPVDGGSAETAGPQSREPSPGALSQRNLPPMSRNTEYWIKPGDTLVGIALKYGVEGRVLCKMNALPPSTLTVTPHLLHTRTTLVLPPTARRPPSPPPVDVQQRLEQRAKEKAAKRLQFVTKEVDPHIARTYVSLAEGEDNPSYKEVKKAPVKGDEVLEGRAIDQYMEDAEWEAQQRRLGISPKIPVFPYLSFGPSKGAEKLSGSSWSWWSGGSGSKGLLSDW